jgi:hypothetical protein
MADHYHRLDGGETTWPAPETSGDIEHALRYGEPTRSDLLVAASYIAAYRMLTLEHTATRRAEVVRQLKAAAKQLLHQGDA